MSDKVWVLDRAQVLPRTDSRSLSYRLNAVLHDRRFSEIVAAASATLEMHDPVLWVSDPLAAKYMGVSGEASSVFDAIDDWRFHPGFRSMRAHVIEGYRLAIERADTIFTVSSALKEYLGAERDGVYWQPNAVHADAFAQTLPIPDDVVDLPRPRIGYVGVLQERVDVSAIAAIAAAMPGASIVLVGPVSARAHFASLRGLANVYFLGERDYEEIPAYLQSFDVCIAPHFDDDFTRSMDPLKLYEYVASGRPVVAIGVGGSSLPVGLMCVARTPGEFVGLVRQEARTVMRGEASDSRERVAAVESASWSARVDEMLSIISSRLMEKCA